MIFHAVDLVGLCDRHGVAREALWPELDRGRRRRGQPGAPRWPALRGDTHGQRRRCGAGRAAAAADVVRWARRLVHAAWKPDGNHV